MKICSSCNKYQSRTEARYCDFCGSDNLTIVEPGLDGTMPETPIAEAERLETELIEKAKGMHVTALPDFAGKTISHDFGLVFGNSSKQAFWGLSTQANRLSRAYDGALLNLKYEAARLGADAVVAVTFALNNSTGSSASGLAGSSEAVMLLGSAVKFVEPGANKTN